MWSQVQKFGLEHCDLPTVLWNVSVLLKVVTLNIYGKDKKGIPLIFYIIMTATMSCFLYVYLVSMLWFVCVRSQETGDSVAAMVVLSLGFSSEIGTLKLLYMLLYNDEIRSLTEAFLDFDCRMIPTSRQATNLLRYMREVKKRAIFYWLVLMVIGCVYVLLPIFRPGRHLPEDLFVIYGLEPMYESPNFEIAFIMMASSTFIICYTTANVTNYLIVVVGYGESQMLSLSDEVTHIWTDAEEYYKCIAGHTNHENYERKNQIMNDHVCKTLKNIILRHGNIKTLLDQVVSVCRGPIAVGFIWLVISLIAELLGGLENTIVQVPFSFIQLGMDCFISQRLMDAGVVFERAVYDCKWENFDKNNRKMVLVMLQVSQKAKAISAGGVAQMSYVTLMAATKATYSAYTTLRSAV